MQTKNAKEEQSVGFCARSSKKPTYSITNLAYVYQGILLNKIKINEKHAFKNHMFYSTEHAYVAAVKFGFDEKAVRVLAAGGELSSFRHMRYHEIETHDLKVDSWPGCDGIIAKLLGSRTSKFGQAMRKKFGLKQPRDDGFEEPVDVVLWMQLLGAKYKTSKEFSEALLETKGKYLYEFDRTAAGPKGRSKWGGCFTKDSKTGEKVFRGENMMGRLLMMLRDSELYEKSQK